MNKSQRAFKLLGQSELTRSLLYKGKPFTGHSQRYFSLIPLIGRVLKLRYIFLGSAVGGGIAIQNKYEDFKNQIPDISWMKQFMSDDAFERVAGKMKEIYDTINAAHPTVLYYYFCII